VNSVSSYRNSIVVKAPVNEVFAYVNDPSTMHEWLPGMIEVRNVVGSGAGQQYEWTYKMVGVLFRGQDVVVDYIENECATHQAIGMIHSSWTNKVAPHEDGTLVSVEIEYAMPRAVLAKLLKHLAERRSARSLDSALLNLKEMLER